MIEAGRDHNVLGLIVSFTGPNDISLRAPFHAAHIHSTANGKAKVPYIIIEILHNFSKGHKAERIISRILGSGHSHLEVRRHQCERVPALISPGIRDGGRPFQHNVLAALLPQVIAHREASLTPADDNGVDSLSFHRSTSFRSPFLMLGEGNRLNGNSNGRLEALIGLPCRTVRRVKVGTARALLKLK